MHFSPMYRITQIFSLRGCLMLFFTAGFFAVSIAQKQHIGFDLKAELNSTPPEKMIHLAAFGDVPVLAEEVRRLGGKVLHQTGDLITFRIPAGAVASFANSESLDYLEFSRSRGVPLNDSMLVNNRVQTVHAGIAGPGSGLTGKDVVIGLVDTGIELAHPDFQNADGSTRVKFLWDQTQNGTPPEPYDYGAEWTSEDIDNEITGHQDQAAYFGHGSTVTGTAAGNGLATGDFKGVAPEADLIVVSSAFGSANWTLTVADAVQYVFEKADELGKPAVVNLSLGTYGGSRDGLDAAALIIDSLVSAEPGRAVVCAVGNSGNWPAYHLGYDVTTDTTFTWFLYNANSGLGYGTVYFELWADTADFNNVQFAMGADRVSPTLQFRGATPFRQVDEVLNQMVSDSLNVDGNTLAVVDYFAVLRGGQYLFQFHVATPDSSQYGFRFMTTGAGRFDLWSSANLGMSNMVSAGLPSPEELPEMVNYRFPDKKKHMVGSWAASPKVISVGNYNNRDQYIDINGNLQTFSPPPGELSINSSHGPTRDNRLKPELSATGDLTLSSGKFSVLAAMIVNEPFKVAPGGMHYRNGGTSMASPVVSGAVALLFEQCPQAGYETIRAAIINNTYQDVFTGDTANSAYGTGKLDVAAALESLYFQPQFNQPLLVDLCEGASEIIGLTDVYSSYQWSSGDTDPSIVVQDSDTINVTVLNESGCWGRSDTLIVQVHELPVVEIEQVFDTLMSVYNESWTYQWLLNGAAVEGADGYFHIAETNGTFSLAVSNEAGCSSVSNEIDVVVTAQHELMAAEEGWQVFPVPAQDEVFVRGAETVHSLSICSVDGRLIYSVQEPKMDNSVIPVRTAGWPAGIYLLNISNNKNTQTVRLILQ